MTIMTMNISFADNSVDIRWTVDRGPLENIKNFTVVIKGERGNTLLEQGLPDNQRSVVCWWFQSFIVSEWHRLNSSRNLTDNDAHLSIFQLSIWGYFQDIYIFLAVILNSCLLGVLVLRLSSVSLYLQNIVNWSDFVKPTFEARLSWMAVFVRESRVTDCTCSVLHINNKIK